MHQHRRRQRLAAFTIAGALLGPLPFAPFAPFAQAQTAADNSKVNQRDRARVRSQAL